jgi:uncharacterized beta-barrel protein YwiB (DUF1934 family)
VEVIMTKEVIISIEGLQQGSEEEPVVMTASGTYHLLKGRHYIQYDEKSEEGEGVTKSTIKISLTKIELSKKGANSSQMDFDINDETIAIYHTPYGSLAFDVKTSEIVLDEAQDRLRVKLEYSLSSNDSHVSNNRIMICIESKR